MAFRTTPAPYIRDKRSTFQTMLILSISLLLIWLMAVVTTFIKINVAYGIKAILMLIVSLAVTAASDVLTTIARFNKQTSKISLKDKIIDDLIHNYSYVTAIIFTLTLPVWVSYYVVIVGSVFATVVVKNLFGGFGKNIFNPAVMARIFVAVCFTSQFNASASVIVNVLKADTTVGATVTSFMKSEYAWLCSEGTIGKLSIFDTLLGNYFGAMGETFTIAILVIGIVLSLLEVINWRTPVFYLGTIILSSLSIALFARMDNPLNYVIYSISLGGVAFGAVFMLTDPVTGPTSPFGKALCGVVAGLLTTLIRLNSGNPEGCMYSIAVCNLISPAIDYVCTSKSNAKLVLKNSVIFGLVGVSALLTGFVGKTNMAEWKESKKEPEPGPAPIVDTIPEIDVTKLSEYGFELEADHTMVSLYDGIAAIYNSSNEIVAIATYGYARGDIDGVQNNHKTELLVGFNIADDTIYSIGYLSDLTVGIEEDDIKSNLDLIITYDEFDTVAEATYSASIVKDALKNAYDRYKDFYTIPEIDTDKFNEYGIALEESEIVVTDGLGKYVIKNGSEAVAVCYYSGFTTTITSAHMDIKVELLVSINIEDESIRAIGYLSDPGYDGAYIEVVLENAETVVDNSFGADAFASTTCSYKAFKAIISIAYARLEKEYGGAN